MPRSYIFQNLLKMPRGNVILNYSIKYGGNGLPRPPDSKKRERILTAAIALFLENGYHETTTLAISQRVKMSSAHMYTYFKDKEDLLVEAVRRMEAEHTALSTELAEKCVGLDDESFVDVFYEAQAKIRPRVRFIALCMLTPGLAHLFDDTDFNYSRVFLPFLKDWPEELAANTVRALMDISIGYFFLGDIDGARAASLSVLGNARLALRNPQFL